MTEHDVKRLPVVDEHGELVGIVSRADLLKAYLRTDDQIRDEILLHVFAHVGVTYPPAMADARWQAVEARMRVLGRRPDALIEVLHAAQDAFGHLDRGAMSAIGAALGVPLSAVYGVATFYSHFTLRPHADRVCVVCTGTACHISGGAAVLSAVRDHSPGDAALSALTTRCPGTCSLAPMVLLDGVAVGPVTVEDVVARLEGA